jgi:hypothetical protein
MLNNDVGIALNAALPIEHYSKAKHHRLVLPEYS